MCKISSTTLVAALTLALPCATALAQVPPLGPDFRVGTPDVHGGPSVAIDPNGRFLVAWDENFGVGSVLAFDRDGVYLGWQGLSGATVLSDRPVHVGSGSGDGFVATWESVINGVEAVLLDRSGVVVGAPFVVSTTFGAYAPRAAITPVGDIVVVWTDLTSDGDDASGTSIQARWFEPDGTPYGGRMQVNTTTPGDQEYPDIAVSTEGLVIVWHSPSSSGTDQSGSSIQGRGFTLDGTQSTDEIQVNSHTDLDQLYPDVALNALSVVVTWQSETSGGDDAAGTSVQARRFLLSGVPIGDDVQVNTYTPGSQVRPAVGLMRGDAFEIVWSSEGSPGQPGQWSVQRQAFAPGGVPAGDQGQVNTTEQYGGAPVDLSMNDHGDFVVAWDAWEFDVRARIFRNTLFVDGFESGDTAAW